MQDHSSPSKILASRYLSRRHHFFKAQLRHHQKQNQHQHHGQECLMMKQEKALKPREWLVALGQILLHQGRVTEVRELCHQGINLEKGNIQQLRFVSDEIKGMLELAMHLYAASKISNMIYYLCRQLPFFHNHIKNNPLTFPIKTYPYWYKMIQTDLFIFGVNTCTQSHFIEQIFLPLFDDYGQKRQFVQALHNHDHDHKGEEQEQGNDWLTIQMHFIQHYCAVLLSGEINVLNRRNKEKVVEIFVSYCSDFLEGAIAERSRKVERSLMELQKFYSEKSCHEQQQQQQQKQIEKQFLNCFHSFFSLSLNLASSLQILIEEISTNQATLYLGTPQTTTTPIPRLQEILSEISHNFYQKHVFTNGLLEIGRKWYMEGKDHGHDHDDEKELLKQVWNSCRYYRNNWARVKLENKENKQKCKNIVSCRCERCLSNDYNIYSLVYCPPVHPQSQSQQKQQQNPYDNYNNIHYPVQNEKNQNYPTSPPHFKPDLSPNHPFIISMISSCASREQADNFCSIFLSSYNKHYNREILVKEVLASGMRNNLGEIVRVLWGVARVQEDDVKDCLQEGIADMVEKVNNLSEKKDNKSQREKYYFVMCELIKFGLIDGVQFLHSILQQLNGIDHSLQIAITTLTTSLGQTFTSQPTAQSIKIGNSPPLPPSLSHASSSSLPSSLPVSSISLPLSTTLQTLEKLGREAYYKNVSLHILLNEIIEAVYKDIRGKQVGYELQMVNRFNGLVRYLQGDQGESENNRIDEAGRSEGEQGSGQEKAVLFWQWRETTTATTTTNNHDNNFGYIILQQLKQQQNFTKISQTLKKHLKQKQKQKALRISWLILQSVPKSNHIESFHYADLIYDLNDANVQREAVRGTEQRIVKSVCRGDLQGAGNWGRFYAELYMSKVVEKGVKLIRFIAEAILGFDWDCDIQRYADPTYKSNHSKKPPIIPFSKNPEGLSQLTCSILSPCIQALLQQPTSHNLLIVLMLQWKKMLLRNKGLKNQVLEQSVAEIMERVHEGIIGRSDGDAGGGGGGGGGEGLLFKSDREIQGFFKVVMAQNELSMGRYKNGVSLKKVIDQKVFQGNYVKYEEKQRKQRKQIKSTKKYKEYKQKKSEKEQKEQKEYHRNHEKQYQQFIKDPSFEQSSKCKNLDSSIPPMTQKLVQSSANILMIEKNSPIIKERLSNDDIPNHHDCDCDNEQNNLENQLILKQTKSLPIQINQNIPKTNIKKMKVIGRSKATKKIKEITVNLGLDLEQGLRLGLDEKMTPELTRNLQEKR